MVDKPSEWLALLQIFLYLSDIIRKHMAHPGGRPTKYDPSVIDLAKEYIDSCSREQTELPTLEGLALKIGVDDETLGIWASSNPEFSATIKELKAKQKNQLINDGMYGGKEVNTPMAIFLLKVNHGMIETQRTEFVGEPKGFIIEATDSIKDKTDI